MPTKPLRVLLVEDSADDAALLLHDLGRGGFEPTALRVETADRFRAAVADEPWDVILCNNSLPEFDVSQALDILRQLGADVPLIVVSGTIGEERAVELMRAGAADYLMKDRLVRLAPAVGREVREAAGRRALRQTEREVRDLAAIVASSDDAIVGKTLDGTVTSWNAGAERLYGYAAADLVGRSVYPLFPPERQAEYRDVLGRVGRGERVEAFESVRVHPDGTRFDVSVAVSPIRDDAGEVVGASAIARDITRRKQADERQARDSMLLANVRDAVIVTDVAGVVTYWNDGATRLYGWTAAEMLGTPYADRYPEQVAGEDWAGEYESRRKDGSRVWIDARVSRITDPAGNVIGVLGLSHDIAARKRAEAAVRASEERFRAMLENSSDVISIHDPPGRMLYQSPSIKPVLGYDEGELLDRNVLDYIHPDDVGFTEERIAQVKTRPGTQPPFLTRFRHRSGEWRWCECVGTNLLDHPAVGGILFNARDVTNRIQAEQALRRSEQRYRTLIEATTAIVWDSPASGEFDSEQPGWTAFTGQTVEQHRGWGWLDAVHPDDRAESTRAWGAAVSTRTVYRVEHRLRRADGEYRHMAVRAVPVLDGGGAIREWVGVHTDVTDQKQAQADRDAALARLNFQIERMPLAYMTTDADFRCTRWNPAAERTFGFTEAEVLGKHPFEILVSPPARPLVAGVLDRLRAGDMDAHGTNENVTKDGRTIVCEWHNTPLLGPDGAFEGHIALAQDVTARIRTAEYLNFSEARYRCLFEAAQDGILIVDPATRKIFDVNPFLTKLTGYSREEFIGKELWEIGLFRDIESSKASFGVLQDKGYIRYEDLPLATKDGRKVDVEFVSNVYAVSDTQVIQCNIRDITARKRSEEALRLRDRAIRAVVGGILITDATAPDNPISYVSPGFTHLTGYTGAEAIGRNCRFLQGKDTDRAAMAEVREAIRQGVPCDVELLNYRKDGEPFWNALSISPVRNDAGRLTNFIGVQTDVTGRRKLENQFHQAQKMEVVGQLAGGVAHDFNNLLTVINGYGEIVHDALLPGDPSRKLVAEIMKAGGRAAGLTRQLLAFSRQSVLEEKVLDPNALVRDVETMLRRLIGEDIDLATRLAPDIGRVKTDPGQLEQAVVNLCVNARDAMPQGGKITVETRNIELDAAYVTTRPDVRPGPYFVLAVSDTGTGMTPEVQDRIFEPFFTTKEHGKGTGLGLAMVFGFVKQSGGHVTVYSEPGRGTTFKLYLPLVADAPLAGKSGALRTPTPMPRGTETVLLVEDEDAVRALGRHVLVMCGYTVLEAGNGRDAVKAADGHVGRLHLLVTDVVMPGGMGGRQVAEAVVARHPEIKVLFTSGYTDDAVIRHGILDEGTHFLQKPFTPTTFAQKVRDVLDDKG